MIWSFLILALAGVKGVPFGEEGGSNYLGAGNVPLFTWVVDASEPQVPWGHGWRGGAEGNREQQMPGEPGLELRSWSMVGQPG